MILWRCSHWRCKDRFRESQKLAWQRPSKALVVRSFKVPPLSFPPSSTNIILLTFRLVNPPPSPSQTLKIFLSFLSSTPILLCCLCKSLSFSSPKSFVTGLRAIPSVNTHQRRLLTSLTPAVGFLLWSPSRVASFISGRQTYLTLTSSFQRHIKAPPFPSPRSGYPLYTQHSLL